MDYFYSFAAHRVCFCYHAYHAYFFRVASFLRSKLSSGCFHAVVKAVTRIYTVISEYGKFCSHSHITKGTPPSELQYCYHTWIFTFTWLCQQISWNRNLFVVCRLLSIRPTPSCSCAEFFKILVVVCLIYVIRFLIFFLFPLTWEQFQKLLLPQIAFK